MSGKYQIFVSSTFEDLVEERDAVIKAILEMGHIHVGMEMFSAADEEQWKIIQRHIDESDYYLVIVAHRYGSLTDGISYTRKEYEYAVANGVPALGFIVDGSASWPADRIDLDEETRLSLDEFKALISQRPVGFWKNAEDLHSKAVVALIKAFTATPREGWVRASESIGPEITAELSRLSSENDKYRREIANLNDQAKADQSKIMQETRATLAGRTRDMSYRYRGSTDWESDGEPKSLREFFTILGPSLIPEHSVNACSGLLAIHLQVDKNRAVTGVPVNHLKDVFVELMALNLVEPSALRHSVNDKEEYWSLTQFGVDFLKWSKQRELVARTRVEKALDESSAAPAEQQVPQHGASDA